MGDSRPRIFLWVSPRSLSSAFLKCVAHMDGAAVWHESYASVYFNRLFQYPDLVTRFPHMKAFLSGFQKAMEKRGSVEHLYEGGNLESSEKFTYDYVREQLEKPLNEDKKFLLAKDGWMDVALDGFPKQLPKVPFKHTFLIRHPNRSALSMRNLLATLFEIEGDLDKFNIGPGTHPFLGWDMLSRDPVYKLWKYVRENLDPNPVVIDADDLQNHPGDIMKKYCEAVGIPWNDKYLSWDTDEGYTKYLHGSLEQIIWGKEHGCYTKAMSSSRFEPCSTAVPSEIPAGCDGYAEEFREGYKVMYEHRLKPDDA